MASFIEKKNLLSPSLYGFHKAHSTHYAVLDIVNTIQTNMELSTNILLWCFHWPQKKAFHAVDQKFFL